MSLPNDSYEKSSIYKHRHRAYNLVLQLSRMFYVLRIRIRIKTNSPKGNDRSPENKQVFLNSSQVKYFFQLVKGSQLCSPWLDKILTSIKGRNSVANLQKMTLYYPNLDLVKDKVYTKFG